MSEKDYSLVTAKAGSIIGENLRLSLATPAGSITPATLTAMVGIAKGEALDLAPTVKNAMGAMDSRIAGLIAANTAPSLALAAKITSAKENLTSLQASMGVTGNPESSSLGNFGSIISQAQGHIQDATEIKSVQNFLTSTSFDEFGSGITNMSSMATQGLDGALGDLGNAAKAFEAAGPVFDLKDMSKFGTSAGLIDKLNTVKLGNASGINGAIAGASLDLSMPEHAAQVDKVMGSITDPKVLSTVTEQLGISPSGSIASLKDLTNLSKLVPVGSGLTGANLPDMSAMASKFSDLGASFPNPAAAAEMLKNIEIPSIPSLNSAASNLSSFTAGLAPDIKNLTGSGFGLSALTGASDLPSISDFTHAVSGGPELAALAASAGNMTEAQIDALNNSVTKSKNLLGKAGLDLSDLPGTNLATSLTFATGLHKYGAASIGDARAAISSVVAGAAGSIGAAVSGGVAGITGAAGAAGAAISGGIAGAGGVADILKSMARPGSEYGDAIKASLAEGKNNALMMANGIKPPNFGETPFNNLPSAGSVNSLGSASAFLGGS